ncbi:putative bifunctional diguanylate cyclase/phosphodiesterase [Catelliglobosispora koreensis]|uniref:putative bifunctional diguanylate cyclase/phosphodiesterase n=1 Tax=Catelliglobosispora koreensis TaxID=129052 RepID=UPI00039E9944|nr:EAL domain-containing protein [Catelliglobosispora koreensis]
MPAQVSAGSNAARVGGAWWPAVFLSGGVIAAVLYVASPAPAVAAASFSAVGLGAAVAIVCGARWFRPVPAWPWYCLAAACVSFLIGAIVRAAGGELLADSFTIPGYALMFSGFGGFLRTKTGSKRHAVIDGLLIVVGITIVFAILFAVPAASVTGRQPAVSALAAIYPLLDSVLVLLVLNLAFTSGRRGASYYMLMSCMVLMLAGDIAYAMIGAAGELTGSPLLDLPFLAGFALVGAAGLHPSMVDIGGSASLPAQAWSARRLLLIAPALAVPYVLSIVIARPSLLDRVVVGVGGAMLMALLLIRAVSAVRSFADAQKRYEYQATHDALTGLANRSLWFTQVRSMLARATSEHQVWVYFLDLDGFKYVNDSSGHTVGDEVITEVAGRLGRCAPKSAAIARVGGDEFVLAYRATRADAMALADVILKQMRHTLKMRANNVVISVSIGIASSPTAHPHDVTAEDLLRDADTAMYHAKNNGRDRWSMFDPAMRDRVQERINIDLALREAMVSRQLHVAYQPVVHLPTGELVGAEALIRWTHPDRGEIKPASFIRVAEESGLIVDIGRWVMREALRQLAEWRTEHQVSDSFWLSVNVSPRQLRDTSLSAELALMLEEFALPASAVTVELTETVMMDPTSEADAALRSLRELGVHLVVDDFGTGFSALGYLRNYPVTGVKIDRSFVAGLATDPGDEAIVRAIVGMSSALRLSVVAEGVENEAQRDLLWQAGVVHGQGWLWGKAADPAVFADLWFRASARAYPA